MICEVRDRIVAKIKRRGKSLNKKESVLEYFNGFHSVVRGNNDTIEVLNSMVGFAGGLMTIGVMMVIGAVYLYIYVLLPTTDGEVLLIIGATFTSFLVLGSVYLFSFAAYFGLPYTPSPIRFNRKTREIYMMQNQDLKKGLKRELLRFDWDKTDFRREMGVVPSGNGPPRIEHETFFISKDLNDKNEKEHKILLGVSSTFEEGQYLLWEYIRRFMNNEEIEVKLKDKEGELYIRKPTNQEQYCDTEDMSEYLPVWAQFKSKLRFNLIYPYTAIIIPTLKGERPNPLKEKEFSFLFKWYAFFFDIAQFFVLLVYPFFAIVGIPGMLISSWAYGTKPINEFPEDNNQLCGLGSMKEYISKLIKNGGKAIETE